MAKSFCFACGRPLRVHKAVVDTGEDQNPEVGMDCYKKIKLAGSNGYQPPRGGPRLYLLTPARKEYFREKKLIW